MENIKNLDYLGLGNIKNIIWNPEPKALENSILEEEKTAHLLPNGALMVHTGKFTGRSPKDKFVVKDAKTENTVWWSDVNNPFNSDHFLALQKKMLAYLSTQAKKIYVRDAFVCADQNYRLGVRLISESSWANLFGYNMFLRPRTNESIDLSTAWTILCVPSFLADPSIDHTRAENFTILDFSRKMILIGGTGYTGEIKKGIFSVLNYVLPKEKQVLSMHCSANKGKEKGDTAIFFGLSGTGKTTLSSDPKRNLIGDDEHGWSNEGIFNFEGGCYAKTVDLSAEKEPQIFAAIKKGALLENIGKILPDGSPDYSDTSITENTRVSYPLFHIEGALDPSIGNHPEHIFFLTCDAFGVLPPLSKLSIEQAMYHFMSGYTAKVAGTEAGITEPTTTFSACFGRVFLPLHPAEYAALLGEKLAKHKTEIYLINTGWTGGSFGKGKRMSLPHTRALIDAVLNKKLGNDFETLPIFNLQIPKNCPGVPSEILNPKNTWEDKKAYEEKARQLAGAFVENFKQYKEKAQKIDPNIEKAGPIL